MRSNCLLWALMLRARRRRKGFDGRLRWRWSHNGPFPHFLYRERRKDGTWREVSYVPLQPRDKMLPPPLFSGRSKWGDL